MQLTTVLKPAALFAAGSFAAAAHAAPTIDTTTYDASLGGTQITIGGASTAQYTFTTDSFLKQDQLTIVNAYYLSGNGNATVSPGAITQPYFPTAGEATNRSVKTGFNLFSSAVVSDRYYGLRFQINGLQYTGYAGVINNGATINQIGYQLANAAGVPEPATWALLIVGFGGVGMAMRRRKTAAGQVAFAA